jgi:8-oxo-dGTP pyrophosphatase MutT (NUDIX family)
MRRCGIPPALPIRAPMSDASLRHALTDYAARWPLEEAPALFLELLDDAADPFVRERLAGHFTASAWLLSADGTRLLMTHHRKLGLWLQLGGHADGERDLALAALREAQEESGLTGLRVEPGIFDLDRHWIPEHKGVPGHWHYDARFVVHASDHEEFVVSEESLALAWRDVSELVGDPDVDASVRRMAIKWLARTARAGIP